MNKKKKNKIHGFTPQTKASNYENVNSLIWATCCFKNAHVSRKRLVWISKTIASKHKHRHTMAQNAIDNTNNKNEDKESKSIRFNYVAHAKLRRKAQTISQSSESHTRPIKLNKPSFSNHQRRNRIMRTKRKQKTIKLQIPKKLDNSRNKKWVNNN